MLGENFSYCSLAVLPAALLRFDVAAAKSGVGVLVAVGAVLDGSFVVGVERLAAAGSGVGLPVAVDSDVGDPFAVGVEVPAAAGSGVGLPAAAGSDLGGSSVVGVEVPVAAGSDVGLPAATGVGEPSLVGYLRLKFHEDLRAKAGENQPT